MMMSGSGDQAPFELSPPPMIGLLPATTVVYILLGVGALLPILLLFIVAVTLCIRRRSRKSSSAVIPVDLAAAACHSNTFGFDADVDDIDDVFVEKEWKAAHGWDAAEMTSRRVTDCGRDCQKRIAKMGGNMEVQSANNPNVHFRNCPPPKIDAVGGIPSSDIVYVGLDELLTSRNYRNCTPSPSCDVTLTSSSRSDVGGDAVSIDPTSSDVIASTLASQRVATPLERAQSTTGSTLQQEEEQVLR